MDAIEFHSEISKRFDDHYYRSSLFNERVIVWVNLINKYLQNGDTVLDAGCGTGIFSFFMAEKGNKVTGIDGAKEMISLCQKRKNNYTNIDIAFYNEIMPFEGKLNGKYDFIISSSVLEYVNNYESCIKDFKSLLNSNGILIISMPNKNSLYRKLEKMLYAIIKRPAYFRYVKNMSTVGELNALMKSNGFEVIENKLYSSGSYLNKIFERFIPREYSSSLFLGVYKKKYEATYTKL